MKRLSKQREDDYPRDTETESLQGLTLEANFRSSQKKEIIFSFIGRR